MCVFHCYVASTVLVLATFCKLYRGCWHHEAYIGNIGRQMSRDKEHPFSGATSYKFGGWVSESKDWSVAMAWTMNLHLLWCHQMKCGDGMNNEPSFALWCCQMKGGNGMNNEPSFVLWSHHVKWDDGTNNEPSLALWCHQIKCGKLHLLCGAVTYTCTYIRPTVHTRVCMLLHMYTHIRLPSSAVFFKNINKAMPIMYTRLQLKTLTNICILTVILFTFCLLRVHPEVTLSGWGNI